MKIKHILTTKQFLKKETLVRIFELADRFEKLDRQGNIPQILRDKILASVFYEPSTRTRFSFESAMLKLGGKVISTEHAAQFSSAVKGETLEDSIKIIGGYADVIVLRHPDVGAAEKAANVSSVPIINAGDGSGEHPTQALLDLYTIQKEFSRIDNLKIGMVGDLRYGRTVHSLVHLLSMSRNIKLLLVSPRTLALPKGYKLFLRKQNISFSEFTKLADVLSEVDVLYVTRVQKERFSSLKLYERTKDLFIVDKNSLKQLRKEAIIMHPLPRVNEIKKEVDVDQRAAYFRQAKNGLYVCMALLSILPR